MMALSVGCAKPDASVDSRSGMVCVRGRGKCLQTKCAQVQWLAATPGRALHEMRADITIGVTEHRPTP